MNTLPITAEEVFDRSKWNPSQMRDQLIDDWGFLNLESHIWLGSIVAQAATGIFLEEERKVVPEGVELGGDSTAWAVFPGAVFLADIEMLAPAKKHPKEKKDKPHWLSRHMLPDDLGEPPERLFRYNANQEVLEPISNQYGDTPRIVVYPYEKSLLSKEAGLCYQRRVGLLIFANNPDKKLQGLFLKHWNADDENQVVGRSNGVDHDILRRHPLIVGQPYYSEKQKTYFRLRSAEQCYVDYEAENQPPVPRAQR